MVTRISLFFVVNFFSASALLKILRLTQQHDDDKEQGGSQPQLLDFDLAESRMESSNTIYNSFTAGAKRPESFPETRVVAVFFHYNVK